MASSMSHCTVLAIIATITLLFLTPATISSSRNIFPRHQEPKTGLRISLKRVDAFGNYTKLELLQRAMERGRHWFQKLSQVDGSAAAADAEGIKSRVQSGGGEFLMQLAIGTPPESYSAILDTGSDLIWKSQCQPEQAKKLSCSDNFCKALDQKSCNPDDDSCQYTALYGDGSAAAGLLATETFTFEEGSASNIAYGCNLKATGNLEQRQGLVGLGRGALSLVSQLDELRFSYCLTSIDEPQGTSTLLVGSLASISSSNGNNGQIITTPLIKNQRFPSFYFISVKGITVGATRLPVEISINAEGNGGLIIDSGTTITHLEERAYAMVRNEFIKQVQLPQANPAPDFDLCFQLPSDNNGNGVEFPVLIFHFDGGADLELPLKNYIAEIQSSACLTIVGGDSAQNGGLSIFGNIQQQNMVVFHDLEKETISFMTNAQCSDM